ncbi:MAG: replication initiation protein [Candidatus Bipolaricaulia bacterium]
MPPDSSSAAPSTAPPSPDPVDEIEEAPPPGETDIVVKANQLIRGRINWTKLEHRVVAMLVAQLKQEDDAFEMQRVHISDLMDMAQVSSRDIYNRAEEVCRKLLNQKVHVRTRTEDGRRMYQGYNCLSTCRYVEGSGYIEAKFNEDMEPFLLQLKRQFTMYRLQNFMQLSSQHSMRMYELIKMREGLRHLCVSVEELREVLCCEHTYERFSDFRRHVLERARTEIRDTCDAYYTYMVERNGRTPVRVRFLIHRQEENGTPPPIPREEDPPGDDRPREAEWTPGENGRANGGMEAPTVPSAPQLLRKAEGRYNLYVSILSRLRQSTLDDLSRSTARTALKRGKRAATPLDPDASPTAAAEQVVRRAVATLRAG